MSIGERAERVVPYKNLLMAFNLGGGVSGTR
jgi:hypothetical protein